MKRKQIFALWLALVLLLCGCGKPAQPPAQETQPPTAPPEETEEKVYTHPLDPVNEDGTFTLRLGGTAVHVVPPEGTEDRGHSEEKVILGRADDGYVMQYSVIEVPGDLETAGKGLNEKIQETCDRASDSGILYQWMTEEVTVNTLDFSWNILTLQPEDRPSRTTVRAWAPLLEVDGMSYYVELAAISNMHDGTDFQFTGDDFGPWLAAVHPAETTE